MVAKNSRRSTMLQKEVGRMGFIITILASLVIMAIIAVSEFMKLRD